MQNQSGMLYTVWLSPCQHDHEYLQAKIYDLSKAHATPVFAPHMTLYTGRCLDLSRLKHDVAHIFENSSTLALPTAGIGCEAEYFRTLYVQFAEDARLAELHQALKASSDQDVGYVLNPHVSLMYQDTSLEQKQRIAKQLHFNMRQVSFNTAKIIIPGDEQAGWRDTHAWQEVFSVKFTEVGELDTVTHC